MQRQCRCIFELSEPVRPEGMPESIGRPVFEELGFDPVSLKPLAEPIWANFSTIGAVWSEPLTKIWTDLNQATDIAAATAKEKALIRKAHQTLKRITNDYDVRWHFNTSVALLMEYVNLIHASEPLDADISPMILKRVLEALVLMLSPMTPHLAEELWQMLGHATTLTQEKWPAYRDELAREEQFEVIIQINGRLRGKMLVDDGLGENETRERALTDPRIAPLIAGKEIVKVIVVLRKLVNIVLR